MARLKILLIDPSPIFLRAAQAFLESMDEVDEVCLARTTAAGQHMLASMSMDLVIADCALLGAGLQHGVARIRAVAGEVRLVLLSLADSAEARAAGHGAGVDAFLGKAEFGERMPAILAGMAGDVPVKRVRGGDA